jgi:hypothetical protein
MARDRGTPLPEITPDPLLPELAPFLARARADLERATDGLDHDAAVEHLEATLAHAAVQASRLGFLFPPSEPDPGPATADAIALGDGSVVVVQRLGGPVDERD